MEKCTNSYERCGGYFDDLMFVKGWTIRDDMSAEKESTLLESFVFFLAGEANKMSCGMQLFKLCEFCMPHEISTL